MKSEELRLLNDYFERILRYGPLDTWDEGIGTFYERIVMERWFRELAKAYEIKTVLEFPCDGITGLLGINSLIFARCGSQVYLANPNLNVIRNVNRLWNSTELKGKFDSILTSGDEPLPFPDNSFDLVWSFCMVERYSNPSILIREIARTSKYVLLITQNWRNWGTMPHLIWHKYKGLIWDHGFGQYMSLSGTKKLVEEAGLRVIEEGALDIPPIVDTWDTPIRGTLSWFLKLLGKDWSWNRNRNGPVVEIAPTSTLINLFLWAEDNLPAWFKKYQAHHLYVLATK